MRIISSFFLVTSAAVIVVAARWPAAPLALCVFVAGVAAALGSALALTLILPIWSRTRE